MTYEPDEDMTASIKRAFQEADANGDGLISMEELKNTFSNLGEWSDEEFETLFEAADQNADGQLDYAEFVDWIMAEGEDAGVEMLNKVNEGGDGDESEEADSDWYDDESGSDWAEDGWEDMAEVPILEVEFNFPDPDEEVTPFEDPDFPAEAISVGNAEGDVVSGAHAEDVTDWKRLAAVGGDDVCLYKNIRPDDVKQGALGNCWFLASCASVASYPQWIKDMFSKTPGIQADGKYEVRLFHPGKNAFMYVAVSDEVPCNGDDTSFSSLSNDLEIWPCLVEKAFAKTFKSYSQTEAGFPAWGMTYLTGGQGEQWDNQFDGNWNRITVAWGGGEDEQMDGRNDDMEGWTGVDDDMLADEKMWKALCQYTVKVFPMCCATGEDKGNMQGIVNGHAYSLICVRSVKTKDSKCLRLVKLRNPHGETEWTGAWGDTSDMWKKHPNVAKELNFSAEDDGSFWMPFRDFCRIYASVSVAKRTMPLDDVHPDKLAAIEAAKKE